MWWYSQEFLLVYQWTSLRWTKEQFSGEYHVVCNGKTNCPSQKRLSLSAALKRFYRRKSDLTRLASCRSIYLFRCYCWSTTYYRFTAGKLKTIVVLKPKVFIHSILSYFGREKNYCRKPENNSQLRWRNTKEIIVINHIGTRLVRIGKTDTNYKRTSWKK